MILSYKVVVYERRHDASVTRLIALGKKSYFFGIATHSLRCPRVRNIACFHIRSEIDSWERQATGQEKSRQAASSLLF